MIVFICVLKLTKLFVTPLYSVFSARLDWSLAVSATYEVVAYVLIALASMYEFSKPSSNVSINGSASVEAQSKLMVILLTTVFSLALKRTRFGKFVVYTCVLEEEKEKSAPYIGVSKLVGSTYP